MTNAKRLEARLTAAIKLAQDLYEDAEPVSIWDKFYQSISNLPIQQQLLISGEALKELAHVTLLKSRSVQIQYDPSSADSQADTEISDDVPEDAGVFLDIERLQKLALQTSSLDLSRFVKPETRFRLPGEDFLSDMVAVQEELAPLPLDDSPRSLEQTLAIAHSESVSDWRSKITQVLENEAFPIDFWVLREKTRLPPSALFLGLFCSEDWYMKKNDTVADKDGYGSILISISEFEDES